MKWGAFVAVASCLLIAGCGGGGASSPSGLGENHTSAVGIASVSYQGAIVPSASFSLSGVTVTSMAGANFSNVTLTPAPKKENSVLVFANDGQILTYQPSGGTVTQITGQLQSFSSPTVTKNGQVFFCGTEPVQQRSQVYSCNLDGSNLHQVTTSALTHSFVTVSPSGSKIAFENGGHIFVANSDGTGETQLTISGPHLEVDECDDPSWSPDGSKIAFQGFDVINGAFEIYTVPNTGGSATEVTAETSDCSMPHWSPNGNLITFIEGDGSANQVAAVDVRNVVSEVTLATAPSGIGYLGPCFTPDGLAISYEEYAVSATQKTIRTQQLSDPDGVFTTLVSYPKVDQIGEMAWSPYFAPKAFIGTGGEMSSAAGFIWGQRGDGFGGFASVSATTPTSLTLTRQASDTTGGPVVYLAKADKITKIVYSNAYFGVYSSVTPANSTQALISVSSTTGQIDTIAPLAEPGLRPSTRGGLVYDGHFVGIYDSLGKNLAPAGATHIELDGKTGGVTSWQ
ncbi:MAG TPA: hypothetical protein VG944_10365 [Fimbriimonas sp.]|nr:hypothetical protein [Fimbriimonas sp.]